MSSTKMEMVRSRKVKLSKGFMSLEDANDLDALVPEDCMCSGYVDQGLTRDDTFDSLI